MWVLPNDYRIEKSIKIFVLSTEGPRGPRVLLIKVRTCLKTFFTTKFENPRFHFSKKAIFKVKK